MARTLGDITQELNERILTPAKAEAESIIGEARRQAATILAEAQAAAEMARSEAAREVAEVRKQQQVDMDTAARNFIIMVQERLEAAVVTPVVDEEVKALLGDPEFLKRMIEILLAEFLKHPGQAKSLEILLPEKSRIELEAWFVQKFRAKAAGALVVQFTDKITFGFQIGAQGQGAHFNFSTGLVEAFAAFCSPRFRRHFFAPEGS